MNLKELKYLIELDENEHLEFKKAENSFSVLGDSGKNRYSVLGYCVALGNEGGGKLILGISPDKPRKIVGSNALPNIEAVKSQIYSSLGQRIEIQELFDEDHKRIILIEIPSRPLGQTFKFYGVPLMRIGEELKNMDDFTVKKILNESMPDWSAAICKNATIEDLDPEAIKVARENFKKKNQRLTEEVDQWDNVTFLDKAKLTIKNEITNAAILLLGKKEAGSLISPAVAQMTWILKGEKNTERDYEHFYCPFLLSAEKLYGKIRNLKYRYIPDGSLFPEEVDMYNPYVIREALHNCIAHQDYSLQGRIQVIENEEGYLAFANKGEFLPGSVEAVIKTNAPQDYYKNQFLVDAMVGLNMIDTIGSGIRRMFTLQKERFFPLPSYDLSGNKVAVIIYGKILDLNYARALARHKDLSLIEIMLLDQIQKGKTISPLNAKQLKEKGLIEGRYPNLYISEQVAQTTGQMAQYLKNRGFHDHNCKKMIVEFLEKKPGSSRPDIDDLLMSYLPAVLSEKQKKRKIGNLLTDLSHKKMIINKGSNRNPFWEIVKPISI